MNHLRIGVVGCGEATQILHLPSLAYLPEQYAVTALCDVSRSVLDSVAERWRIEKRVPDYQELVTLDDVDVVLIANPDVYHAEVALAAIAAGKHVLIEKPMCLTLGEADAIIAAQQRAGVTVQVGYMRRYAPAFVEACRVLPELGQIRLARVHAVIGQNATFIKHTTRIQRGDDVSQELIEQGRRLRDEREREAIGDLSPELRRAYGLLLGLSSHDLSAMRELLGMPKRVLYAAQRQGGSYITAAFDYDGYVCQFETGVDTIPRFDAHLEVYGAERVLHVQYDTPYVRNLPIRLHISEASGQAGMLERSLHPAWGDAFVAEWQAFYENVKRKQLPKTSAQDFRQDLELFRDMIAAMGDPRMNGN